jgi:hypothetical protein
MCFGTHYEKCEAMAQEKKAAWKGWAFIYLIIYLLFLFLFWGLDHNWVHKDTYMY